MRARYWTALLLAANALHLWAFLHLDTEAHPVASGIFVALHTAVCIGPFWMTYDWFVKRKQRTFKVWLWLFFFPWGFLWYYFEIYRLAKHLSRVSVGSG
jgi:hypothetical protein